MFIIKIIEVSFLIRQNRMHDANVIRLCCLFRKTHVFCPKLCFLYILFPHTSIWSLQLVVLCRLFVQILQLLFCGLWQGLSPLLVFCFLHHVYGRFELRYPESGYFLNRSQHLLFDRLIKKVLSTEKLLTQKFYLCEFLQSSIVAWIFQNVNVSTVLDSKFLVNQIKFLRYLSALFFSRMFLANFMYSSRAYYFDFPSEHFHVWLRSLSKGSDPFFYTF